MLLDASSTKHFRLAGLQSVQSVHLGAVGSRTWASKADRGAHKAATMLWVRYQAAVRGATHREVRSCKKKKWGHAKRRVRPNGKKSEVTQIKKVRTRRKMREAMQMQK